jgi:hypothetical protein
MITVGSMRYDTTAALFEGTASFPGHEIEMRPGATVPEVFARLLRDREFDVAELGLGFLLRVLEEEPGAFVAIPAFPNRIFRHACVYVNVDAGIESPADLVDRTIGEFGMYSQDSGVWAKGILADEYGFDPARNRWVIGGLEAPMTPFDFVPQIRPAGVDIVDDPDHALSDLLDSGEIDALFSANEPSCFQQGSPRVRRLFVDYPAVERDWFRRTGIFPMMHVVVVRAEALAAEPDLARAAYQGFLAAKDVARDHYLGTGRRLSQVHTMLPWASRLVEDDVALMGEDWWPYGVAANRTALDTFLRYQHEQGLSAHRFTLEEIVAPELLDT